VAGEPRCLIAIVPSAASRRSRCEQHRPQAVVRENKDSVRRGDARLFCPWALRRPSCHPLCKRSYSIAPSFRSIPLQNNFGHVVIKEDLQLSTSACLADKWYEWEETHKSPLPLSVSHNKR